MKKSLVSMMLASVLSLGVLSVGGSAMAQSTPGAEGHRGHGRGHGRHGRGGPFSPEAIEHRITRLTERLSLDAHQVILVREILASARTEAEALRAADRGPERRAQFRALMESTATRIDAILNETQRAQFTAMRAEMRERFEARRARRMERREERREERAPSTGI